MDQFTTKYPIILFFIIALAGGVIGFAGGLSYERQGGISLGKKMPSEMVEENGNKEGGSLPEIGAAFGSSTANRASFENDSYLLAVADQPTGSRVTLSEVKLGERSWIVIHEASGDAPGMILGAGRFQKGVYSNLTVDLVRPLESGKTYLAMIHQTDADALFNALVDLPLKDSSGTAMLVRFMTE